MFRIVIFSYLIINLFLVHLIACDELRCANSLCSEIIGRGHKAQFKQKFNVDVYGVLNGKKYLIKSNNNSSQIVQAIVVRNLIRVVDDDKLVSIKGFEAKAIIAQFDDYYAKEGKQTKDGNAAKSNRTSVSRKPLINFICSIHDIFRLKNVNNNSFDNVKMTSAAIIMNHTIAGSNVTKSAIVKNQTTETATEARDMNDTNVIGPEKVFIDSVTLNESAKNNSQPEQNFVVNETNAEPVTKTILFNQSIVASNNRTKTQNVSLNSTGNSTISDEKRTIDADVLMKADNVSENENKIEIEASRAQNVTSVPETEIDLTLSQTMRPEEIPSAEQKILVHYSNIEETLNISETILTSSSELPKEYTNELSSKDVKDAENDYIYSTMSSLDAMENPVQDVNFNEIEQDLTSVNTNNYENIENAESNLFVSVAEPVTETTSAFTSDFSDFGNLKKEEQVCRASFNNDSSLEIVLNKLYDLLKSNLNESSMNLLLVLATTSVTIVIFLILSNYLFSRKTDYKFVRKFNEIERNYLKICQEKDRLEEQLFEKNNNYQSEYDAVRQQLCESENERTKIKSELDQLKEVSRKALNKYTSERNKKNAEIKQFKDQLRSTESELRSAVEEHIKCKLQLEEMAVNLKNEQCAKETLEDALNRAREKINCEMTALADELNTMRDESDRLRDAKKETESKLNAVTIELDLLKNKFSDENQSFFDTDLVLNNNELEAKSKLLSEENIQLLDQLKQLETEIELSKQSITNLTSKNDLLNERLNQATEENGNLLVKNQVLEVYFKDKESELQRQLDAQKALAAQKEGDSSEYLSELDLLKQENISLNTLIGSMKQEHSESLKSHKSQCMILEQKNDHYYLRAHNAERELEETRLEAKQLRNILAEMSRGKAMPTLNMNGGSIPSTSLQSQMNNLQNANHFTPIQKGEASFNRTPEISLSERNKSEHLTSDISKSKPVPGTPNTSSIGGEIPSPMPFFMNSMGTQQQVLMSDQQRPSPLGRLSSPTPPTALATTSQTHSPLPPSSTTISSSIQSSQSLPQAHMPPALMNFAQFQLPPPHLFHQQFQRGERSTPPPPPLAPLPPPPPLPLSSHPLDFRAAFPPTRRSLSRSSHSSSSDSLTGSSVSESESPEVTSDQSYVDDSDALF